MLGSYESLQQSAGALDGNLSRPLDTDKIVPWPPRQRIGGGSSTPRALLNQSNSSSASNSIMHSPSNDDYELGHTNLLATILDPNI